MCYCQYTVLSEIVTAANKLAVFWKVLMTHSWVTWMHLLSYLQVNYCGRLLGFTAMLVRESPTNHTSDFRMGDCGNSVTRDRHFLPFLMQTLLSQLTSMTITVVLMYFQHEDASLKMFDHMIEENDLGSVFKNYKLEPRDIDFIKEQIAGPRKDREKQVTNFYRFLMYVTDIFIKCWISYDKPFKCELSDCNLPSCFPFVGMAICWT